MKPLTNAKISKAMQDILPSLKCGAFNVRVVKAEQHYNLFRSPALLGHEKAWEARCDLEEASFPLLVRHDGALYLPDWLAAKVARRDEAPVFRASEAEVVKLLTDYRDKYEDKFRETVFVMDYQKKAKALAINLHKRFGDKPCTSGIIYVSPHSPGTVSLEVKLKGIPEEEAAAIIESFLPFLTTSANELCDAD